MILQALPSPTPKGAKKTGVMTPARGRTPVNAHCISAFIYQQTGYKQLTLTTRASLASVTVYTHTVIQQLSIVSTIDIIIYCSHNKTIRDTRGCAPWKFFGSPSELNLSIAYPGLTQFKTLFPCKVPMRGSLPRRGSMGLGSDSPRSVRARALIAHLSLISHLLNYCS
jgi:hypothetical protein